MGHIENLTYFISFGLYFALSVLLFFRRTPVWLYRAVALAILIIQGISIGFRWSSTGHPPILGTFEESLCASWTLTLFTLILDNRKRFAFITVPFAFLTLFYGLGADLTARPLIISEQSLWVYFHVLFAWIAYGFYTLCLCASVCILYGRRCNIASGWENAADWLLHNGLLLGFSAQTVMFLLGAYYSTRLHGVWWMWDPVEFLFVVSWFAFAIAIHGRLFYGWRLEKVSAWTIASFAATMLLYWGLRFFPWASYHVFDIEVKMHMLGL